MFRTYRFNGNGEEGKLPERIGEALNHFQETRGSLPTAVIVNPKHQAEAEKVAAQVVKGLAKAGQKVNLPVEVVGGCLANEVWLATSNGQG